MQWPIPPPPQQLEWKDALLHTQQDQQKIRLARPETHLSQSRRSN